MRNFLFLLLLFLPFVGNAGEPDIPLSEEACNFQDYRRETSTTSFTAQIISNNLIKVQSTDIASFEVRILNAQNGDLLYDGSTFRGILHITTSSLSAGQKQKTFLDNEVN